MELELPNHRPSCPKVLLSQPRAVILSTTEGRLSTALDIRSQSFYLITWEFAVLAKHIHPEVHFWTFGLESLGIAAKGSGNSKTYLGLRITFCCTEYIFFHWRRNIATFSENIYFLPTTLMSLGVTEFVVVPKRPLSTLHPWPPDTFNKKSSYLIDRSQSPQFPCFPF